MRINLPVLHFNPNTIKDQITQFISEKLALIDSLCENETATWENLVEPITFIFAEFQEQFHNPIETHHALTSDDNVNEIDDYLKSKEAELEKAIYNNSQLFSALRTIKQDNSFHSLSEAQQKTIDNMIQTCELNGVHLPKETQNHVIRLKKQLIKLTNEFESLSLQDDESNHLYIPERKYIAHLPESIIAQGEHLAQKISGPHRDKKKISGICLPLETLMHCLKHIKNRTLRKEIFIQYISAKQNDRSSKDKEGLMKKILACRAKLANTLGFNNYAEYALQNKAFTNPEDVIHFLLQARENFLPHQRAEQKRLADFAKKHLGLSELEPWDLEFAEFEKQKYLCNQPNSRFVLHYPEDAVWRHLQESLLKLYGLTLAPFDTDTWHPDVKCFQVKNKSAELVGFLYFDLYQRTGKKSGGWTSPLMMRRRLSNGDIQLPVAIVTCNFIPPHRKEQAIYNEQDITTLFHECGHALQHILTKMDIYDVSGFNNVPWDVVEVASTFFEHWGDNGTLSQIVPTLTPIEDMLYQIEMSLCDFLLHYTHKNGSNLSRTLRAINEQYSIDLDPELIKNTHIFGDSGYGSCYYSYLISKAISATLFAAFKTQGAFNSRLGQKLKETLLENGSARDPLSMYLDFLSVAIAEEPTPNATQQDQAPEVTQTVKNSQSNENTTSIQQPRMFLPRMAGQRRQREDSANDGCSRPSRYGL